MGRSAYHREHTTDHGSEGSEGSRSSNNDGDSGGDDDDGGGCRRVSRPPRGIVATAKLTNGQATTRQRAIKNARVSGEERRTARKKENGMGSEAERETRGYARLFGPILWGGNENAQGTRKRDHLRVAG